MAASVVSNAGHQGQGEFYITSMQEFYKTALYKQHSGHQGQGGFLHKQHPRGAPMCKT